MFGNTVVSFSPCDGIVGSFDEKLSSDQRKPRVLECVLPEIPAKEVFLQSGDRLLPKQLQTPLIKVPNGSIQGTQSGRRSAIISIEGIGNFRLKGCGDLNDGFPLKPVERSPEEVEIRGCMFQSTCFREMYYTNLINHALTSKGLPVANIPIGWWQYDSKDAPHPSIPRFCGIFQTFGDLRLSDHLLVGLENLLPIICQDVQLEFILKPFPLNRISEPGNIIETWMAILTEDFGDPVDFRSTSIRADFDRLSKKSDDAWNRCRENLVKFQKKSPASLLAYTYWRLGESAGKIHQVFAENSFCWGTFEDRLGFHCNAHPNNLVVVSDTFQLESVNFDSLTPSLLAPLDFDMAFSRSNFQVESQLTRSGNSEGGFSELLEIEKRAMKMSLSGDHQLNSGSQGTSQFQDEKFSALKWALRDTLICGFDHGMQGGSWCMREDMEMPMRFLIQLALLHMQDTIS
eukprot:TRINITY_DN3294_c0_g1_i1.p1 TRINITY_DN3294_c0_g1~~TRINITY_DN3294_c0_g1_i1.p1  ORF type:complete len:459 (-),score=127.04 TRINITY_DN3294_c0_g1_i1:70-1446(-)